MYMNYHFLKDKASWSLYPITRKKNGAERKILFTYSIDKCVNYGGALHDHYVCMPGGFSLVTNRFWADEPWKFSWVFFMVQSFHASFVYTDYTIHLFTQIILGWDFKNRAKQALIARSISLEGSQIHCTKIESLNWCTEHVTIYVHVLLVNTSVKSLVLCLVCVLPWL